MNPTDPTKDLESQYMDNHDTTLQDERTITTPTTTTRTTTYKTTSNIQQEQRFQDTDMITERIIQTNLSDEDQQSLGSITLSDSSLPNRTHKEDEPEEDVLLATTENDNDKDKQHVPKHETKKEKPENQGKENDYDWIRNVIFETTPDILPPPHFLPEEINTHSDIDHDTLEEEEEEQEQEQVEDEDETNHRNELSFVSRTLRRRQKRRRNCTYQDLSSSLPSRNGNLSPRSCTQGTNKKRYHPKRQHPIIPPLEVSYPYHTHSIQKEEDSSFQLHSNAKDSENDIEVSDPEDEEDHEKMQEEVNIEEDVRFSILSNTLFLWGGSLYLIKSIWDLQTIHKNRNDPLVIYQDDEEEYDDRVDDVKVDPNSNNVSMNLYNVVSVMGPIMYLLNALFDYVWALLVKESNHYASYLGRMDAQWDMLYAVFFGVGAIIDICTASLRIFIESTGGSADEYSPFFYLSDIASTQFYLVSAIFFLMAVELSCSHIVKGLVLFGDSLFLLGSCIDAVNAFMADPDFLAVSSLIVARTKVGSNTLWTTNAILYLLGDCIIWCAKVHVWRKLHARMYDLALRKQTRRNERLNRRDDGGEQHHELEFEMETIAFT